MSALDDARAAVLLRDRNDQLESDLARASDTRALLLKAGSVALDQLKAELEQPWRCNRCHRPDLKLKHAIAHGTCPSRTSDEEDALQGLYEVQDERDTLRTEVKRLEEVLDKWGIKGKTE